MAHKQAQNMSSQQQQRNDGGFLSGNGEIPKGLVINKSMLINPDQKNSLLGKLDMFLPQLQQANQNLPTAGTGAATMESSAVQIFFDNGDDEDEDEEEEVDERTVEMNISMFPIEDDEEEDEIEENKAVKRVQEMD